MSCDYCWPGNCCGKCAEDAWKNANKGVGYMVYKQEAKMTRQEAIAIAHRYNLLERHIEYLEALGLIKFEESVNRAWGVLKAAGYAPADINNIIEKLQSAGYQIVKLGKNTTVRLEFSCLVDRDKYNGKLLSIDQGNNLDTK